MPATASDCAIKANGPLVLGHAVDGTSADVARRHNDQGAQGAARLTTSFAFLFSCCFAFVCCVHKPRARDDLFIVNHYVVQNFSRLAARREGGGVHGRPGTETRGGGSLLAENIGRGGCR